MLSCHFKRNDIIIFMLWAQFTLINTSILAFHCFNIKKTLLSTHIFPSHSLSLFYKIGFNVGSGLDPSWTQHETLKTSNPKATATCYGHHWTMNLAGAPCVSPVDDRTNPTAGDAPLCPSPETRPFVVYCHCENDGSGHPCSRTDAGCGLSCLFCRCCVVCCAPPLGSHDTISLMEGLVPVCFHCYT